MAVTKGAHVEKPKVGEVVRLNLPQIFEHCIQDDPQQIVKLSDKQYCSEVFKLNFAFFRTPAEIESTGGHTRYWKDVHHLLGHEVRVTSQWHARHLAPFLRYLVDKGLTPVGVSSAFVEAELDKLTAPKPTSKTPPGGSKYKLHAIGNAQNSAVRYVLGNLGKESFTEKAWLEVKRWFGHRCAYCSSRHQLVMDHAVPISIDALGEHKLGNLVPACHECNSGKGKLRYDEYLRGQRDRADASARIATLEEHMAHHEYEPLSDLLSTEEFEQVRKLLRGLRDQVAEASASTASAINDVIAPPGKAEF
jgi:hypothetical protein